jgi:hypothetical protein
MQLMRVGVTLTGFTSLVALFLKNMQLESSFNRVALFLRKMQVATSFVLSYTLHKKCATLPEIRAKLNSSLKRYNKLVQPNVIFFFHFILVIMLLHFSPHYSFSSVIYSRSESTSELEINLK